MELQQAPPAHDPGQRQPLARAVAWASESLPVQGTCKIAGDALRLTLRLEHMDNRPPDVLKVEAWLAEAAGTPLIVEELAIAAAARWGAVATVTGRTDTHGTLTAKVWP